MFSFPFLFKVICFCSSTGLQLAPCALLALLIHPSTSHNLVNRIFWAFCVYLEAVSVLPQLRVMQNTKVVSTGLEDIFNYALLFLLLFALFLVGQSFCFFLYNLVSFCYFQIVEPFTAHYVFALGVARFLSCAHWVLQV